MATLDVANDKIITLENLNDYSDALKTWLGTAANADVATVAIGTENENENAIPTVGQIKEYLSADEYEPIPIEEITKLFS